MPEISSNYMLNRLRAEISKSPDDMNLLRGLYMCGRTVVKGGNAGISLVSNGKDVKTVGVAFCHNSWCCPRCTAKQMAMHERKINCIIAALKERSIPQIPIMVTFTMPHTRYLPLDQALNALYATWKAFRKRARAVQESDRKCRQDIFAKFVRHFESDNMVRATEITYGKHGWHPHFHVLLWIREDKFDDEKLLMFEREFQLRWQKLIEKYIAKYYKPRNSDADGSRARYFASRLCKYANWSAHPGVYFSKTPSGQIFKVTEGGYICGNSGEKAQDENWNMAKELTALAIKHARGTGSRTTAQLLYDAVYKDDKIAMQAYMEFARVMRAAKHHRINYAPGLNAVSKQYMNTAGYREVLLKKSISREKTRWHPVCWFSRSQWSEICHFDDYCPILGYMYYLATKIDGYRRIRDLLNQIGIYNILATGPETEAVLSLLNGPLEQSQNSELQTA